VRVLIVEDDGAARAALRMLLELRGYMVDEAAEGDGAVAYALAHRPDVALIDIGLPGLDGYGVARRIREGVADTPMVLIALTGYLDVEERGLASDTGFDAHLVKPLKSEHLFELLGRIAGETARPS
jgi:CheY-like chemotaxis protein